jgi:hypothetical protein
MPNRCPYVVKTRQRNIYDVSKYMWMANWCGVLLVECRDEGPSVVDLLESGGQQDQ